MAEVAENPVVFKEQEDQRLVHGISQNVAQAIGAPVSEDEVQTVEELHPLNQKTQQQVDAIENVAPQKGDNEHEKGSFLSRFIGGIFAKKVGVGPAGQVLDMKQHDVNRRYQGRQKLGD